jgi:hypothetical protein
VISFTVTYSFCANKPVEIITSKKMVIIRRIDNYVCKILGSFLVAYSICIFWASPKTLLVALERG